MPYEILLTKDDDLVDPVDEFGREVGSYGTHHKLLRLESHRSFAHVISGTPHQGCWSSQQLYCGSQRRDPGHL